MKYCPSCQTQYTDDTLRFCLEDGTPLAEASSGDTPTVVMNESETVVRGQNRDWQQSQVTRVATAEPQAKRSNTPIVVVLAALLVFLVVGVAAIGAWLYFRNGEIAKNTNLPNTNNNGVSNTGRSPSPTATPTSSPTSGTPTTTPTAPVSTTPVVSQDQDRRDVSERVYSWKSHLESRNLSAYMSNYADTVDYFNNRGASVGSVRADKQRAFSRYNSMRVSISNMSVTTDDSGDRATAVFDKEWVFEGGGRSAGKVRSQLQFRKINGNWLITGERDLKVYYTN